MLRLVFVRRMFHFFVFIVAVIVTVVVRIRIIIIIRVIFLRLFRWLLELKVNLKYISIFDFNSINLPFWTAFVSISMTSSCGHHRHHHRQNLNHLSHRRHHRNRRPNHRHVDVCWFSLFFFKETI